MLIIQWRPFWNKTTIITWFVNQEGLRLISFIIGFSSGILLAIYLIKQRKKKLVLDIKRGGIDDLSRCIEPGKTYEVIDPKLDNAIRSMFDNIKGLIIIEPGVAIMANYLAQELGFQFAGLGFKVAVEGSMKVVKTVGINFGAGMLVSGVSFWSLVTFAASPMGLTFALTLAIGGATYFGVNTAQNLIEIQQCHRILQEVPSIVIPSTNNKELVPIAPVSSISNPVDPKIPRLFIDDIDQRLRIEEQQFYNCDSVEEYNPSFRRSVNPDLSRKSTIQRKCEVKSKYVPLSQRTKTINDIKKHDDTKLRDKSRASLDRYERKAERFQAKRVRIMNDRLLKEKVQNTNLYEHDYDL